MASHHARVAASFDRLADLLTDAATEAAACANAARTLDRDPALSARLAFNPDAAVLAGLTAALADWYVDYARAIDTAQPEPGSIPGN